MPCFRQFALAFWIRACFSASCCCFCTGAAEELVVSGARASRASRASSISRATFICFSFRSWSSSLFARSDTSSSSASDNSFNTSSMRFIQPRAASAASGTPGTLFVRIQATTVSFKAAFIVVCSPTERWASRPEQSGCSCPTAAHTYLVIASQVVFERPSVILRFCSLETYTRAEPHALVPGDSSAAMAGSLSLVSVRCPWRREGTGNKLATLIMG